MKPVVLEHNTLIVRDGGSFIVYSPFTGQIARVTYHPLENPALYSKLSERGFFRAAPERVAKVSGWDGFNSLTLLLTRSCNLQCTYCYASATPDGETMPLELAIDALEWFASTTPAKQPRITFHGGGEPTLQQDTIRAVVAKAKAASSDRPFSFLITTNGTAPKEFMDWLMQECFGISISADGPADVQDRNRPLVGGDGSSNIVEATIRHLATRRYPFTVRVTYSPKDDIERILKYLASIGVQSVHLEPLFPFGRAYDHVDFGANSEYGVYAPDSGELIKQFITSIDTCARLGLKIYNGHLIHFTKGIGYFCGSASARAMVVTHDGLLTGCLEVVDANDPDAATFVLGKWLPGKHSFSIDREKIRKQMQERHADVLEECKTCFARYTCAGGCAVKAVRASGNFMDRDEPYCGFTRGLVPIIVRRIAAASQV